MPTEGVMPEATLKRSEATERISDRQVLLYAVSLAAMVVAALSFALFLASTPWFLTHDAYPAMFQSGYGTRLNHADCDVVLYGDSTALTGLDPQVVQNISGLKTCNVSEVGGIFKVVGSRFPLDAYLKNNKRPRILLLMYAHGQQPAFFEPFTQYAPEGMMYGLQHEHNLNFMGNLLLRPVWLAKFSVWAGYSVLRDMTARAMGDSPTAHADSRAQRASLNGLFPFPLPPQTHCVTTTVLLNPTSIAANARNIEAMRQRYSVDGTQVLVNVSPTPDCSILVDEYRRQIQGQHDNAMEALPIRYFNDNDSHFSTEGTKYLSIEAGKQVLAVEQQQMLRGAR